MARLMDLQQGFGDEARECQGLLLGSLPDVIVIPALWKGLRPQCMLVNQDSLIKDPVLRPQLVLPTAMIHPTAMNHVIAPLHTTVLHRTVELYTIATRANQLPNPQRLVIVNRGAQAPLHLLGLTTLCKGTARANQPRRNMNVVTAGKVLIAPAVSR
jgi:hypothetical protein